MSISSPITRIASRSVRSLTLLFFAAIFLAGCATTQTASQIDHLETVKENPRILLMPPDIKYYLLTAGGVTEPNQEWTEAAQPKLFSSAAGIRRKHRDGSGCDGHCRIPQQ